MKTFVEFCEHLKTLKAKGKIEALKKSITDVKTWLPFFENVKYGTSEKAIRSTIVTILKKGKNNDNIFAIIKEIGGDKNLSIDDGIKLLQKYKETNNKTLKDKIISDLINDNIDNNIIEYIVRIILGKLAIGISFNKILTIFDPHVAENYMKSGKIIFDKVNYGSEQCIYPMLAKKNIIEIDANLFKNWEYIVCEEKFDGQRIIIHKTGDKIKFMTRQRTEFKPAFTKNLYDYAMTLTDGIDFILDGELLMWENDNIVPLSRGGKKHVDHIVMIFDIIYLDDTLLIHQPWQSRNEFLKKNIQFNDRFRLSETQIVQNSSEGIETIKNLINKARDEGKEGFMLKNPKSLYLLNSRSNDWLKVKKCMDNNKDMELRLLVIKGVVGNNEAYKYTSFEVACVDENNEIHNVGKVCSGLTHQDLKRMNEIEYDEENRIPVEKQEVWSVSCTTFFENTKKMRHAVFRGVSDKKPTTVNEYEKIVFMLSEIDGICEPPKKKIKIEEGV